MKFSEKWGDSVDNAVELALADLKLSRDDVVITVLEEPTRGFFGIGSKLAKVRVEEKAKEKQVKEKVSKKEFSTKKDNLSSVKITGTVKNEKPENKNKKEKYQKTEKKVEKTIEDDFSFGENNIFGERPEDLVEVSEHPAKVFLSDMFKEMNLNVNIKVSVNKDSVYIDIDGVDSGTVIGKRGQTLDAIQYLTSLVVNKGEGGYTRVVLDAEGYRQTRELALEKLAVRLAEKVKRTGKSARLEPMNPYERKVIHTALQKVSGVTTKSEGEEPYRRVVIELSK